MVRSLASIEREILELDASSQEEILRLLVGRLDGPPDPGVEGAWIEEAQRRNTEIDSGDATCVPADEVFERLDAQLKK
jgi:hypothetical protein